MKNYYLILINLFVFTALSGQNSKALFGNFVFSKKVFQYEYQKSGSIHTLRLSTLAGTDHMQNIDTGKLNKSIKAFQHLLDSGKLSKGTLDSISWLKAYSQEWQHLSEKNSLWQTHSKDFDSLTGVVKAVKIDSLLAAEEGPGIYSFADLLQRYKTFLQAALEPQQTEPIPFTELKEDVFASIFKEQLTQLLDWSESKITSTQKEDITKKANEVMYEIRARHDFMDDEPITAHLNLKRKFISIDVTIDYEKPGVAAKPGTAKGGKTKSKDKKSGSIKLDIPVAFKVANIKVEFEDGTIKHILADLIPQVDKYKNQYGNTAVRFRNYVPISASGKFDPDEFSGHKIFSGNSRELMNILYEQVKKSLGTPILSKEDFSKNNQLNFVLSDLLDFQIVPQTDQEDYSPANVVVELNETRTSVELKKEKRSKILSARAYTDFVGLNEEQPNGLVQVEVSRRINLLTNRLQATPLKMPLGKIYAYFGCLTFIEPRFTLSKLEENNRYYALDSSSLIKETSFLDSQRHFRVNPLELQRYQQWSLGLTANMFKVNFINKKTNVQINALAGYGQVEVVDSLSIAGGKIQQSPVRNISRLSTLTFGGSLVIELKPDARWGLSFGQDLKWLKLYTRQFELDESLAHKWDPVQHTTWLEGYLKTNETSRLFFRFRKHWLNADAKHNFYQMQMGYELDLFKAN